MDKLKAFELLKVNFGGCISDNESGISIWQKGFSDKVVTVESVFINSVETLQVKVSDKRNSMPISTSIIGLISIIAKILKVDMGKLNYGV
ncbi:MAG: hypothetical protein WC516_06660 [Patescibacteria group bacterium]|jgi:hypothetical protein